VKFNDDNFNYYKENGNQLLPFMQKEAKEFIDELLLRDAKEFVESHSDKVLPDGHKRIVLNGDYPRNVLTTVGALGLRISQCAIRSMAAKKLCFSTPCCLGTFVR
jgi:hypothetical protein